MTPPTTDGGALALDLYALTMAQSYWARGMNETAVFSLAARHLPPDWGFFLTAGLEDALRFLEHWRLTPAERAYLASTDLFSPPFLSWLARVRFSGSVRAMPEGTLALPNEPFLEVTAPLIEGQLVEAVLVNRLQLATLIASKAARCVLAAPGRRLIDFGLRRTHGLEAALTVARSAYLAGFAATSNVQAGQRFGIPLAGTMAHAYIQAFGDELTAFRAYAQTYPDACTLLIDTYDTLVGAQHAVTVGHELAAAGHQLRGVRIDSGDLLVLSQQVRARLDAAGLTTTAIMASGNLDERTIAALLAAGAPIDSFGVGSRLGTAADAPYLDVAYKLVAYADRPTLKLSVGKATWPGAKQVYRRVAADGTIDDLIALADEPAPAGAQPLLIEVMRDGQPLPIGDQLTAARARAAITLATLPAPLRPLAGAPGASAQFSPALMALRTAVAASAH